MYQALAEILDQLPQTAEIIFADDGSTDGSAAALDAFAEGDRRVRVLHLSRNYGQTSALMAAIRDSYTIIMGVVAASRANTQADRCPIVLRRPA